MAKSTHPGIELAELIYTKGNSQRELASTLNVAHSLLNNILKGNRNINANLAIALEAAGFKDANYWLTLQVDYLLDQARSNRDVQKQKNLIETWEELGGIIPLQFLKKQDDLGISSSEDVDKVLDLFGVNSVEALEKEILSFNPQHFRKSSKFSEDRSHVLTWSVVAEKRAKLEKVGDFDVDDKENLLEDLKECFYKNSKTLKKVRRILSSYGIKFVIQDRPNKTPVDGKSFISGNNPAIALSLKYKRLDNFAFTLMHELGHVFLHLAPSLEKNEKTSMEFYVNNAKNDIEEFEADSFAQENLISSDLWTDFIIFNHSFKDSIIYDFAEEHRIHPAIVRGRVCYEFPEYYRRRTSINNLNKLDLG